VSRKLTIACIALLLVGGGAGAGGVQSPYRTLNDKYAAPPPTTLEEWKSRAGHLRAHVLASAGLLPMPEKTPLRAEIFGEISRQGYSVSKVFFESLPGFFVTGNLYRPTGDGPFPAILSPHGHWAYGRLENTDVNSGPGRAINLARQGFVVFAYDMIGYVDSQQLPHTFDGLRERLWGLSLAGLQLWNSIRSVDFLESLPYVRRDALAATGESGGGTQTFLLAAVDDRIRVAAPVNMISLQMQGGCLCENPPGLRLDTTNVEIAATIAPRPLLMVSATGDWTAETLEKEYPAVRTIYQLFGAADRVHAVRFTAVHNYNRDSREAMYAWMARWLQNGPADVRRPERSFTPEPLQDLLVFHRRSVPPGAVTAAQLTDNWIEAAKRQLAGEGPAAFAAALRHAVASGSESRSEPPNAGPPPAAARTVLLATSDGELEKLLTARGFLVRPVSFTTFDGSAASKVRHFETYNRTAAGQRVADIVAAVHKYPGASLVADGEAALAGLLAAALVPVPLAILDVTGFDTSSDSEFVDRLYIPGLRRAGDLQTAASLARGRIVVHNAGARFAVSGIEAQAGKMTAREIADVVRGARAAQRPARVR
jgi:dienelactone hydrolase